MRKTTTKEGDIYNNLIAIKFSRRDSTTKTTYWEFVCKVCNNKHITRLQDVRCGKIKSCGCEKNKGHLNGQWNGLFELSGRTIGHYKRNALKRNIEFNVSEKYLWDLYLKQNKKCPYTNIELIIKPKSGDYRTPSNASLDRIDSSIGYVQGNLQWVYKPINVFKNSMSKTEFINMCKLISSNNE
jgi:hypothetical protein